MLSIGNALKRSVWVNEHHNRGSKTSTPLVGKATTCWAWPSVDRKVQYVHVAAFKRDGLIQNHQIELITSQIEAPPARWQYAVLQETTWGLPQQGPLPLKTSWILRSQTMDGFLRSSGSAWNSSLSWGHMQPYQLHFSAQRGYRASWHYWKYTSTLEAQWFFKDTTLPPSPGLPYWDLPKFYCLHVIQTKWRYSR